MEIRWTDRQYHVQYNANAAHQYVRIYCKNQFSELPFCRSYSKLHGTSGLSKHYHSRFDPKLGNDIFEIFHITCSCVACTSMLYKPCIYGIPSDEKERYKPVTKCTYWPVFGSFKIEKLSNYHRTQPLLTNLMKHNRLFLMEYLIICHHQFNQKNIKPLTKLIQQLMDFMLS